MIFDPEDENRVVDYLVKSRRELKSLPDIKLLKKQYKKALKENTQEFHDDIQTEFIGCCKTIIAQEVSKNTGLATDGIVYLLDCMGLIEFEKYLGANKKEPKNGRCMMCKKAYKKTGCSNKKCPCYEKESK